MSFGQFRSLQVRLAVRLAVLYVAAAAIAVGVLVYQVYDTAGSLNDRELGLRAEDLARAMVADGAGQPRLDLPAKLAAAYAAAPEDDLFAIRDTNGRVIAASPDEFGERVSKWPPATDEPSYFRLSGAGSEDFGSETYYGLSVALQTAAGPMWLSVARTEGSDALIRSILREFVVNAIWVSPLLMLATLAIGIFAIRNGLKPVREVSRMAASIGPDATSVRLPEQNLPTEIMPLVASINHALDRLEKGFAVQREFTANAAHELRTPLAIINSALETMDGNSELEKLRTDVARMNRLVEQLLRVARLDSVALEFGTVDLNKVASLAVAAMAPWAIAQGKAIAFAGTEWPVNVKANVHALEDALRNLIENAVLHTPAGTEVTVTVDRAGRIDVADRGRGVLRADRENIFKRFWRGVGEKKEGAGLGLAIVSEIMRAHRGSVSVADNPGGGAVFTLSFPPLQTGDSKIARRYIAGDAGRAETSTHNGAFETDKIERDCDISDAAVLVERIKRRRLKPSPLSGTCRFREENRRAIRLNRRRRHRCRREGDRFASRPPFCRPPHSGSRSLRYTCRCGRWRRLTIRPFATSPTPALRSLGDLPQ
jgi:signal transduction histidine kinase